jgi:hypothetical protein
MMMKRILSIMLLALLLAIPEFVSGANISVEIISKGRFHSENIRNIDDPSHIEGHHSRPATRPVLVEETDHIKPNLGAEFGFSYRIKASPEVAEVTLRRVTRFPVALTNPSTGKTQSHNETLLHLHAGANGYAGWRFNEEWELMPGYWYIELWNGDVLLTSQKFIVEKN